MNNIKTTDELEYTNFLKVLCRLTDERIAEYYGEIRVQRAYLIENPGDMQIKENINNILRRISSCAKRKLECLDKLQDIN